MSENQTQLVTDSTNEVPEQVLQEIDTNQLLDAAEPVEENEAVAPLQRPSYEVVFFARYGVNPRPSAEDLTMIFSKYGDVHHVNCPNDKNFAFIFMTKLHTTVEHRRTRTTIGQIIRDMTPETRFHITVASSNRGPAVPRPPPSRPNNRSIRYPSARYQVQRGANQENRRYQNRPEMHFSACRLRRPSQSDAAKAGAASAANRMER